MAEDEDVNLLGAVTTGSSHVLRKHLPPARTINAACSVVDPMVLHYHIKMIGMLCHDFYIEIHIYILRVVWIHCDS